MTTTDTDLQLVQNEVQNLKARLETAQKVLVVYDSPICSLDQVAMATSLYLVLKNKGIQTSILSLGEPMVAHSSLVGIDEVVTHLPQEGLIISLDNSTAAISNVSCDAEESTQSLKIYVRTALGKSILTADQIQILPLLAEFDQIIAFGVSDVSALSNIGLTGLNEEKLVVFNDENLAHSQLLANLFRHWLWTIDEDIATNLLMGIDDNTANFSRPDLSAETFEITGWLLRSGGRRYLPEVKQRESSRPDFYQDNSFSLKTSVSGDRKKAFYYKKRGQAQGQKTNPNPTPSV